MRNLIDLKILRLLVLCILPLCSWGAATSDADLAAQTDGVLLASGGIQITAPEIIFPKPTPPDGATTEQTA
ncbi:MAG TPA: hypothetical protein VKM72_12945 [Thermoanaerobaculia bacterium]|nr:hypothetical protein [Thermoanaerobaculia bacterium]